MKEVTLRHAVIADLRVHRVPPPVVDASTKRPEAGAL